jgi:hypothetical protein
MVIAVLDRVQQEGRDFSFRRCSSLRRRAVELVDALVQVVLLRSIELSRTLVLKDVALALTETHAFDDKS